ncbi:hypothetical protein Agub_g11193, partial [Astrephomene gubernaculifera]
FMCVQSPVYILFELITSIRAVVWLLIRRSIMSALQAHVQHPSCRRALFPAPLKHRHTSLVHRAVVDRESSQDVQSLLALYDGDGDGRLTLAEAQQAFAAIQTLETLRGSPKASIQPLRPVAQPVAPASSTAPSGPATWDVQVLNGIRAAKARGQSSASALSSYIASKLRNSGKSRATASDVVWSFCGMFAAVAALGVMSLHVRSWPLVGEWHQQGLNLLLGSFGTICVLLFARPEAEAMRIWNFVAGHVIATATVVLLLHLLGPGVFTRALAMGLMVAFMLLTDSVHPPGGALVLMAVDSAPIQNMDWWFMLYPSLVVTAAVLLPLSLACNWLKAHARFDFPTDAPASPAPSSAPSTPPRPHPLSPPSTPPSDLRPKLA